MNDKPELPMDALREYCGKWKISELAVFGSYLREDFRPDSDIDFLVTWAPGADWSLIDVIHMEAELTQIVGRKADLVSRRGVERSKNWIRRKHILESAQTVVAA